MRNIDFTLLSDHSIESAKLISIFFIKDFFFRFLEKDNTTNLETNTTQDLILSKYSTYEKLFNATPLNDFIDDIDDLFDFTFPFLNKIVNNPRTSIKKNSAYIGKEKVKNLDSKTFIWLGNKPGSSIKEKFSNLKKIKSYHKVFSYITKENQVVSDFVSILYHYELNKFNSIQSMPAIFGFIQTNDRKNKLTKLLKILKLNYSDLLRKRHVKPNNVLLNDKNYSPIWRSYKKILSLDLIGTQEINHANILMVIMELLKIELLTKYKYEYLDRPRKLFNHQIDTVFMSNNDLKNTFITIELNNRLIIKFFDVRILKNKSSVIKEFKFEFNCEILGIDSVTPNRGIPFSLNHNKVSGLFYFDSLGIKDAMEFIQSNIIKLSKNQSISEIPLSNTFKDFMSLASYDSHLLWDTKVEFLSVGMIDNILFPSSSELFILNEPFFNLRNVNYDYHNLDKFLFFLKNKVNSNHYLIYDASDIVDEFAARTIRNKFINNSIKAYPVWRSILAGETKANLNIKFVFDFCGNQVYLTRLQSKNDRFIHIGPIDYELDSELISEREFLMSYIEAFSTKFKLKIENQESNLSKMIDSGRINQLLINKNSKRYFFAYSRNDLDKLISIHYDQEIFDDLNQNFVKNIKLALHTYGINDTLLLIPSFIVVNDLNEASYLHNNNLIIGANVIRQRLLLNEVTWYERLPNLSLEIIKNGIWDIIDLTKNREEENVIGKKVDILVDEGFVLKKGISEFHLPLRKSFLGESNEDYIAILKHPSFPLNEDVYVNLKLIYQYGAENPYRLFFIPRTNNPLFNEIEVVWENAKIVKEDYHSDELINPSIILNKVTDNQKEFYINHLESFVKKLVNAVNSTEPGMKVLDVIMNKKMWKYPKCANKEGQEFKECFITEFQNEIFYLTNRINRLYTISNLYYKGIIENPTILKFVPILEKWILEIENSFQYRFVLQNAEQLLAILTLDPKYIKENFYRVPEAVFGRYLSALSNNTEMVELVYKYLIIQKKTFSKKVSNAKEDRVKTFLQTLTSASAINHRFLIDMYEISPSCVLEILKLVLQSVKSLQKCLYLQSHKKAAYYMNDLIELMFAFLFLRDKVAMKNFNPNQKLSIEIIVYLKEYLRNYMQIIEEKNKLKANGQSIKIDNDLPSIKTKLIFSFEKPPEFNNVPDSIYSLFLYLSGNLNAKKVMIHAVED